MYMYVLQYVSIDTYTMYCITCILTISETLRSAPLHNSNSTIEQCFLLTAATCNGVCPLYIINVSLGTV